MSFPVLIFFFCKSNYLYQHIPHEWRREDNSVEKECKKYSFQWKSCVYVMRQLTECTLWWKSEDSFQFLKVVYDFGLSRLFMHKCPRHEWHMRISSLASCSKDSSAILSLLGVGHNCRCAIKKKGAQVLRCQGAPTWGWGSTPGDSTVVK